MAIYTVAANKKAYIQNYWASLNKIAGGGDPNAIIEMWHQDNDNGYAPQSKHILGLDANASSHFSHPFVPPMEVGQKTDIYLTVTNLSASAVANVSGGFDLILVDD
jgi:hypothetical protein